MSGSSRGTTAKPVRDPEHSPRAGQRRLTASGAYNTANAPAHGQVLTSNSIGAVITRAAAAAGLTIRTTGHSVRRGMATGARKAGHDVQAIARQGGWSPHSPAIWEYFEVEDAFSDNALTGIGL